MNPDKPVPEENKHLLMLTAKELLDEGAAEWEGARGTDEKLKGHFRGRRVKFHLKAAELRITLDIVKLREIPPLSRRKRSALERKINNLETAMKRSQGAQTVNLTVPPPGLVRLSGQYRCSKRCIGR